MLANLLFGDQSNVELETATVTELGAEIVARTLADRGNCPACNTSSGRVHSRYARTLADVAMASKPVTIRVLVRRFFCDNSQCARKIFAESLGDLASSSKRQTNRMLLVQQQLALALGGEGGARLGRFIGVSCSGDTLLRRVRVVGIDDGAIRRGQTYGTLICDLERKRPVAVLPTRSAETLIQWLKAHPEIEIISRDRAGDNAKAATRGALRRFKLPTVGTFYAMFSKHFRRP